VRTGELFVDLNLFRTPGVLGGNVFALRWRSEVSGLTQTGLGMLPSWEHTVEKVILNSQNPEGNGGHEVRWRRPDGLLVTYDWDGTAYSTLDCSIHDTLSKNGSGNYVITGKWGATKLFDANGMPDKYTDRNGNVLDFTYNSSYQWTAFTDDRGRTYTIHHDADGFIDYIDDPASRRWSFGYDTSGNLTSITAPDTACVALLSQGPSSLHRTCHEYRWESGALPHAPGFWRHGLGCAGVRCVRAPLTSAA